MSCIYQRDDLDLCCLSLVKSQRCFGVGNNNEKSQKNLMLSIFKDGNHHILETRQMFEKQRRNQSHNIFNRWLQLQRLGVSSVHRQIFLLMHLLRSHLVSSTWRQARLQPMIFPFSSLKEPKPLIVKLVGMKEQDRKGEGS